MRKPIEGATSMNTYSKLICTGASALLVSIPGTSMAQSSTEQDDEDGANSAVVLEQVVVTGRRRSVNAGGLGVVCWC